jgi:hypothetical protein
VVTADRQEPREFALRARVRLQRHRVVPGDLGQPRLELIDQVEVARDIGCRGERVDAREFRPRDRGHLGRRVELHRARPERDHAPVERVVAVGEAFEIPHHGRLAAVRVEDGVREELVLTPQTLGQGVRAGDEGEGALVATAEDAGDLQQFVDGRGLIDRDAHGVGIRRVQQDAVAVMRLLDVLGRAPGDAHPQGVEERVVHDVGAVLDEPGAQQTGLARDTLRDRRQSVRPVVHRVHGGHDREQHLGGADVRGRLLATDVLLAGLQRQTVGGLAVSIDRDADEATGQLTLEPGAHRHVAGVRTAEAHRHPEALGRAHRDIGAERARRREECQREQIGRDDRQAARDVRRVDDRRRIPHATGGAGVLHEHAEQFGGEFFPRGEVHRDETDAHGIRPVLEERTRLRKSIGVDREHVGLRLGRASREEHALGDGGGLVEHRRVGGREPREVGDHRLEVDERLEAAL